MERLNRYEIPREVYRNVTDYLAKELPTYKLECIFRASNHPEDNYLYQVVAKSENGYACWTCWNETTQLLNYGHYNLANVDSAIRICNEMYHEI